MLRVTTSALVVVFAASGLFAADPAAPTGNTVAPAANTPAVQPDTIPAQAGNAEDWRVLVKERTVPQPESDSGAWKFTPQPFPPIADVAAQKPDDVPLYGCYSWGEDYTKFRKEIKEVGWTAYRFSGPPKEEALVAAMEDGLQIMETLQIGTTKEEFIRTRRRDFYESDEDFIQAYLPVLDEFCLKYGPGGSLFEKRPDLARNPVRYIEIWSEPNDHYLIANGPDFKAIDAHRQSLYAKLLKDSYAFIKKKHPAMTVVGFAASGRGDKRLIEKVHALDPAVATSYDIVSTHPYCDAPPMAERNQGSYSVTKAWSGIQDVLAKHGSSGKPMWYSEVGWAIPQRDGGKYPDGTYHPPTTVWLQAANVVKMYVLASRLGVRRVFIMSLTDASAELMINSGFFDSSTKEWRPSAHAAQQMIRLLPKPRIQAAISEETGGLYAYQFKCDWTKEDSKEVIIAWQEQKRGDLRVPIPAGRKVAKVLNMLGGEEKFSVNGDTVQFEGGPLPSYLVLE